MHHVKSDSEVTSLAASSPPRSPPRRPAYFVQSPSRDSHDGGDSKTSFHSTPLLSPSASPLHPGSTTASSVGAYSRSRDSSGNLGRSSKGGSRRMFLHNKNAKPWSADNIIEEEPGYDGPSEKQAQLYTALLVLLVCLAFLFFFILFFWLACKPSHPEILVKNVLFHNFYVGSGADTSGVPTKMVSLNCTVQLVYYNPSKFFGAHISSPVGVSLDYSELSIGTGPLISHVQEKRTRKTVSILVQSQKVPIYGAGASISSLVQARSGIPIQLTAVVESEFNVVGRLVRSTFENRVVCGIILDSTTMKLTNTLTKSCTYNPSLT